MSLKTDFMLLLRAFQKNFISFVPLHTRLHGSLGLFCTEVLDVKLVEIRLGGLMSKEY